ncbi:MAG: carboxynorspermidine decarboxylase [Clostridiaceae bacterium]|jgi:carboxynorspermidine decarboxylase|nr:carboxynorspermidine decarboxylase [Clostridiaceae bacterium]
MNFDIDRIRTPYYIVDENKLTGNLEILRSVSDRTGCKILLAQKAFSMFAVYPLIKKYLAGTTASGLYEAKLGHEEMGGETHIFSAAYKDDEFDEICEICDHIVFNSFSQLEKFKNRVIQHGKEFGIRINPEHSTQDKAIYDPCSKGSRLGVTLKNFREDLLDGISGIHFHTLCEQNSDDLASTLEAVEKNFGKYLYGMKWVNFGGGHHITRDDYDIETLVECIMHFKEKYNVEVYLEPGEAVALNAGYLVATVLDIVNNDINIAIIDASAACHMPDVLEMPYRPVITGSDLPGRKPYTYRIGGPTCLAGDIIGDYSFDEPLETGKKLIFCDMAIYTMVKNNTFNGMKLPSIALADKNGNVKLIKEFGYYDFKNRLS